MGPDTLGRLVDRHAAALVLYARQWTAAPEDVVQEAFLKLVKLQTPPDNPAAWLFRVVRNAAISSARAHASRRYHESRFAASSPSWFELNEAAEIDATSATAALATLPAEEREVVTAHLWGGQTFEEIGSLMGCSASSAHRWYVQGLSRLREKLGAPCPINPLTRN